MKKQPTEFSMTLETDERWRNTLVASVQKGTDMFMSMIGKRQEADDRDYRVMKIASMVICEIATEEGERQKRLITGKVLNRNEVKEHFRTMEDIIRAHAPNARLVIRGVNTTPEQISRMMKLMFTMLKAIDDMHETGVTYASADEKKRCYILQNTYIQRSVLEMITLVAQERERLEATDPDAYRELSLVCRRLNKAVGQVSSFDSTSLDNIVPER